MSRNRIQHAVVAVLLLTGMLSQATSTLAGTTGRLDGTVTQAAGGAPVANAKVTTTSPSQTTITQTDGAGHFVFISLAPDTYSVVVEKEGYLPSSQGGVSVFADATQSVTISMETSLKTIGTVTARAAGNLVKSGTTADVYSINAATQDKISALGGGGGLNNAYSAIASVPGAFVPLNQQGYFQTVHIRGGDYDQAGYELDGVPVNRSFDNYPSGGASSLGQQELQVYTGASPATSEGQGLAGYINQVIKTGTYPGFSSISAGIGAPAFYHKLSAEAGGASPNRMFSYYAGVGGYDEDFRYVDNNNGAGATALAGPLAPIAAGTGSCPANLAPTGCYSMVPYQYMFQSNLSNRDVVANVHFGIPHHNDSGRDDIQLLWDSGSLTNPAYGSTNDEGGFAAFGGAANAPAYADGYEWTCGNVGGTATTFNPSCVSKYYFPGTPAHAFGGPIQPDLRDVLRNNQEIVKLQYQKNFGSDAYLRIYGYTYYSSWMQNGPNSTASNFLACCPADYELSSHTRGVSATLAKQFNEKNLVTLQGSYTTAASVRDNNTQMLNAGGARSRGIVMVNANDPLSGNCFDASGTDITCNPAGDVNGNRANFVTWANVANGTMKPLAASCNIPGGVSGPCTYLIAENSLYATYNRVVPKFTSVSLTDEFRPSNKLLLNAGVRYDQFQFVGADTRKNDPARAFWYKAWNLDNCIDASGAPVDKSAIGAGLRPTDPCPSGFTNANMTNQSGVATYNIFQPRLGGTYTINPDTVVRFSAGKYSQPPNAAFEQYDTLQEDTPFRLSGSSAFYALGFTSPGIHEVRPPTSLNFDLSLEKRLKGTDWSFKLTPFLRRTKDQIQNFFLDQKTAFVSGINVGRQTSKGFEFQLNKGDFSHDGLSGQLSLAYTNSSIRYDTLKNGSTVVTGINSDIQKYDALTKGGGGSPCYLGGSPSSCAVAGAVANPYYNAPAQPLIDANDSFATYSTFPGPLQSSGVSYGAPYVGALVLNYKHDKFAITPSIQFQAGARYGEPETTLGVDPGTCGAPLSGSVASNDPRYPYGAPGGGAFDATNCGTVVIPNQFTGKFDNLGSFVQPNQLAANLQISYTASPKVSIVGTFANLVDTCWGGTKAAWTLNDRNVCSYNILNVGGAPGVGALGNLYNPPATVGDFQRLIRYPYAGYYGATNTNTASGNFNQTKQPFQFFLEARIKI
ncbi:MAG: TonB-dependent receptor [Candidatus Eremiobacteraeota bacterium]|nr:TonB-dependent receptor [Candidatus Eremiobacteraeota bacterium]